MLKELELVALRHGKRQEFWSLLSLVVRRLLFVCLLAALEVSGSSFSCPVAADGYPTVVSQPWWIGGLEVRGPIEAAISGVLTSFMA